MARQINRLVARTLPGLNKPGRHNDGGGLYLNVSKLGAKSWVFMFKQDGNPRRELGLGSLTTVSLADAREKARVLRNTIADGIDPKRPKDCASTTFSVVATDLVESLQPGWRNAKHGAQWTSTLKTHAATLWDKPVDAITTQQVLDVLTPIWSTVPETATRVRARIERVLDAAKVKDLREGDNPARWRGHLEIMLPKRKIESRKHHPAMPYATLPTFMVTLRKRPALSARALEFLILTAARTSEVLKAEWNEFDLAARLWMVPARRSVTMRLKASGSAMSDQSRPISCRSARSRTRASASRWLRSSSSCSDFCLRNERTFRIRCGVSTGFCRMIS